jgi:hypothetical protein
MLFRKYIHIDIKKVLMRNILFVDEIIGRGISYTNFELLRFKR